MSIKKRFPSFIFMGIVFLAIFFLVCLFYLLQKNTISDEDHLLTNPVSELVRNKNLSLGARSALQDELSAYGSAQIEKGTISTFALYFREVVSGPVVAINQNLGFSPASLLKIPVALWYFKQAEERPGVLSERIFFSGPKGISVEAFPPKNPIQEGKEYSIQDLIELMLAESDNDATAILVEYAGGREVINTVYDDLGLEHVTDYNTYTMDTHTYAGLFRVLFNNEYLSEKYSNVVLRMLTQSSFTEGIRQGVPEKVLVAHKFGERVIDVDEQVVQLHDCGIVYEPDNPYLLCIMTQGKDYWAMSAFIGEMSRRIYEQASSASL